MLAEGANEANDIKDILHPIPQWFYHCPAKCKICPAKMHLAHVSHVTLPITLKTGALSYMCRYREHPDGPFYVVTNANHHVSEIFYHL